MGGRFMANHQKATTRTWKEQMAILIRQRNYFEQKANQYRAELKELKEQLQKEQNQEHGSRDEANAQLKKQVDELVRQSRAKEMEYQQVIDQLTHKVNEWEKKAADLRKASEEKEKQLKQLNDIINKQHQ